MKKTTVVSMTMLVLSASILGTAACNSPAEPDITPTPGGDVIAWFNGTGYTVDLYFPGSDSLVQGAYVTGSVPGDILSPGTGRIAVLNATDCSIQVFDVDSTGSELYSIALPQGSNPYLMCWDGQHLWVTLLLTDQVARVELQAGGSVSLFDVGPNPTSIASDGARVFVGHGNWPDPAVTGGISVIDAVTGDPAGAIQTPDNVCFMKYFETTGNIHAVTTTYTGDGLISVIDPLSMQVTGEIAVGSSPGYPSETPSGFVTGDGWFSGTLYFYTESGDLETWNTGHFSSAGVVCLGDTAYVTDPVSETVFVADCGGRTLLDTLQAGASGPQGITAVLR
jgi:hypothetical protein